jgi:hypothetical protein
MLNQDHRAFLAMIAPASLAPLSRTYGQSRFYPVAFSSSDLPSGPVISTTKP